MSEHRSPRFPSPNDDAPVLHDEHEFGNFSTTALLPTADCGTANAGSWSYPQSEGLAWLGQRVVRSAGQFVTYFFLSLQEPSRVVTGLDTCQQQKSASLTPGSDLADLLSQVRTGNLKAPPVRWHYHFRCPVAPLPAAPLSADTIAQFVHLWTNRRQHHVR